MVTETATNAKIRFGQMLEKSQQEPVLIEKSGRNYAVILSFEDYERLSKLEDSYWSKMAAKAMAEGFLGTDESARLLESLVNEKG